MMKKFFRKDVFSLLSAFCFIWFLILAIGTPIAKEYSSTINNIFGVQEYVTTGGGSTYYTSDYLKENGSKDDTAMRQASKEVATDVATDGCVLLWNKDSALPLSQGSQVSLFGIGSIDYKISGGGSGEIKASQDKNLKDELEVSRDEGGAGFKVNSDLYTAYNSFAPSYGSKNAQGTSTLDADYNGTNGYTDERYREFYVNEVPWDTLNAKVSGGIESSLSSYGDAAIMVITRDGCEDGDTWFASNECYDSNYLDLSYAETNVLTKLSQLKTAGTIKKIVVILNTAQVFQMKHLSTFDIDACLFAGNAGVTSFKALGQVLSGLVNPSGALVDTIAYDVDSAPATENFGDFRWSSSKSLPETNIGVYNNFYVCYQEGIYVGYRYYETRYEDSILNSGNASSSSGVKCSASSWKYESEVAYPFGYGSSYTTFSFSNFQVEHTEGSFNGTYKVSVDVTNTGTVAGKTPVEIYLQKPYTDYDIENGIEKSSVELVGFTKSSLLEPNQKETYEIDVKGSDFKTYDSYNKGTYILEDGDYYLSLGTDSHNAVNNILSSKGHSSSLVDSLGKATTGDSSLAKKITIAEADYTTYSKSEYSDYEIKNELSDADINLYEGTSDQKQKYLSRNHWDTTYPTPVVLSCTNDTMVADMQYSHGTIDDTGYTMPLFSTKTVSDSFFDRFDDLKEKKLKLIMLLDLNYSDPVWDDLLNQLSWSDMNYLLSGGYLNVNGCSIGLPSGVAADGTSGVRINNPTDGTLMGFPTETVMAQTWDTDLINKLGVAFGHECLHTGCDQLYAPSADMHRTPYGGRNWEYYSEDPFISGKMLANEVKGIQSKGIITTVKHFAFNDQEINRCGVATFINEQTAREIYLKTFEIGINEGKVSALMASFPRLGTKYVGSSYGLMHEILRKEWIFNGFVETDSAFNQEYMTVPAARAEAVIAGVDFWMDGSQNMQWANYGNNARVVQAAREATHRYLYTCLHSTMMNGVSSNSQTVHVEPAWKSALAIATIVVGAVTIILLGMTIAAFVLHRNDHVIEKTSDGKTTKSVPMKDKVMAISGVSASAILLILVGCLTITSSITNFKKTEDKLDDNTSSVVDNRNSYEFKATDEKVFSNGSSNADEDCVGIIGAGIEVKIVFYINSEADGSYSLYSTISENPSIKSFTDVYKMTLNNEEIVSDAQTEVGATWNDYSELYLGDYNLVKGTNVLGFTYTESDASKSYNFRSVRLVGESPLTLVVKPEEEQEPGSYVFKAVDDHVIAASGAKKIENQDQIGWDATLGDHVEFTYYIRSTKAENVPFYVTMSGKPAAETFTSAYETYINNTVYQSEATTPITASLWSDYLEITVGSIDLISGVNIIKFVYRPADWQTFNFRSIRLVTESSVLSWGN